MLRICVSGLEKLRGRRRVRGVPGARNHMTRVAADGALVVQHGLRAETYSAAGRTVNVLPALRPYTSGKYCSLPVAGSTR